MISIPLVHQGEIVLHSKEESTVTKLQKEDKALQIYLANSFNNHLYTCYFKEGKVSQDASTLLSSVKDVSTVSTDR